MRSRVPPLPAGCWSSCGRQGAAEPALSSSSAAEPASGHRPAGCAQPETGLNLAGLGPALRAHLFAERAPWLLTSVTFLPFMMGGAPDLQEYQIQAARRKKNGCSQVPCTHTRSSFPVGKNQRFSLCNHVPNCPGLRGPLVPGSVPPLLSCDIKTLPPHEAGCVLAGIKS